ncbi:MAG: glycerophosphodiester phosphodiesterase [Oscillospiraceae bacterium]|jgi:glycerophosphoryl diester phosphodiesterase|nr:glycerophosphodiester phosphodiesterase [Oscillospiraceae bacterium]
MGVLKFFLILDLIGILLAGLYLLSMMTKRRPKMGFYGKLGDYDYAHRGLHAIAAGIPENSLRAFRLAANNGYGAELDVHLSRDGRLVVMHDENLKRTTGVNAKISAVTTQVLNQLSLEGTKEKIPYLEEVLPLFVGKTPLLIELKTDNNNHVELTRKVTNLLKQYPDLDFMIESFDPRVLRWLKKNRPEIIRGQLSCDFFHTPNELKKPTQFLLGNMMFNFLTKPDFIAYQYEDRDCLAPGLCKKIWRPQMFYWVVRSQEDANRLAEDDDMIIFEGFAAK